MRKVLDQRFFNRPVVKVAHELIGKYLVRKIGAKTVALMITETEAYDGEEDLACHASKDRTKRTEVMFGKAGQWYVYLVYGMYEMLNIVTGQKNYPAAVLIRGVAPLRSSDEPRSGKKDLNGPGKLTRFFEIDRRLNAKKADKKTNLWIEDRGAMVRRTDIIKTPRIVVDYAGEVWKEKLWRFVYKKINKKGS